MMTKKVMTDVSKKVLRTLFSVMLLATFVMFTACSSDDSDDPEPEVEGPEAAFVGSWSLAAEAGALAVGPSAGSSEWWSLPEGDLAVRACMLDDTFSFAEDGSFTIDLGSETWLEGWQTDTEGCGSPVAPHVSSAYQFSVNEAGSELTIMGTGAFIALPKVNNEGELGTENAPASTPTEITFQIQSVTESRMELRIEVGSGVHWTFKLTKN